MATETGKYKLSLDIANQVSNELLLMLLGFTAPDQMFDQFVDMEGLELDVIPDLLADINKEILLPLRGSLNASQAPAQDSAPNPASPAPRTTPPAQPSPQPVSVAIPPIDAPASAAPPMPHPVTEPVMRTMAGDMQAMKEHPEGIPHATVSAPFAQDSTPRPAPTSPVPAPQPVLEHAPIPVPPQPIAPATPAPDLLSESGHPARTVAPPPNLPGAPIVKEYGTDPYREPLE